MIIKLNLEDLLVKAANHLNLEKLVIVYSEGFYHLKSQVLDKLSQVCDTKGPVYWKKGGGAERMSLFAEYVGCFIDLDFPSFEYMKHYCKARGCSFEGLEMDCDKDGYLRIWVRKSYICKDSKKIIRGTKYKHEDKFDNVRMEMNSYFYRKIDIEPHEVL